MTMQPILRSFLFVPAANERLLDSALSRPADAVILDLEDGTHPADRERARAGLPIAMAKLREAGKTPAVRINNDWLTAVTDLRAAVQPGLQLLVLPKVEHPRDLQVLGQMVAALEAERGIPAGTVRFLLQIETTAALPRLAEIAAASPRSMGMMLGSEDFSLDCGCEPTAEALLAPSLMVLHAARAARLQPIGVIASIADLGAIEAFHQALVRARSLGFFGAVVVHPKFLEAVNAAYTPGEEEIDRARRIVSAFEEAFSQGVGAIRVDGLMVDKPVYGRALNLLHPQGRR
jgi:citrate lyase subunit beta/citryl-CoA lyase